ncbi:decarboxylating 6-phosphogluconate dehydrogenase [Gordonia desulfuricans]|uniref:Decarboxylating 6-phosphogluconate dehydrogenase n=1 Tax=Gordonia desulfuricans TaxID=89051 RepID=A0A7K3LRH9_9ACTN|nr:MULTISPECIES: decarboxylating 6-phosphogluconate dehydrogenase [Gordonia]EMP13530.1 6-phosphogluconate dehydrogenase [Gordonia sp. NB41Y]NDK90157.1 decarboxylating 6-phosphogluconate dehydrogenase [Gordonia desulfuricans]WLP88495.1 decarboxylating 6-phosphogluconate dehydrogenase [Gordonia sp. NB41Y]
MQLGLIGLGKMGANMRTRITAGGHQVVGYDPRPEVSDVASLADLVGALEAPRAVWVMVPSGDPTRSTVAELAELLAPGDIVVDGGNSRYTDDIEHSKVLGAKGIGYIDCGVSGGVWGLENGYGLMAGGSDADIARLMPIFDALRPEGERADGFVHSGPVGAGHYAKMVHNGIEYGLMHAYGEGYELLAAEPLITDVEGTLRAWTHGTVIRSWLLDLLVRALQEDPGLAGISDYTTDSGEGRWTVEEAIRHSVPANVISAALFARFASRQDGSPALKAVSALRNQFGGHSVRNTAGEAVGESGAPPSSPVAGT